MPSPHPTSSSMPLLRRPSPRSVPSCVFPPRRLLSAVAPQPTVYPPWDAQQAQRSDLCTGWIAKVIASMFLHVQPRQRYVGFVVDQLTPSVGYHVVKRLAGCPRICFDFFKFSVFDVGVKHVVPTYSCLIKVLCRGRLVEFAREVVDVMWVDGHCLDSSSFGMLVVGFAELGRFEEASELVIRGRELNCTLSAFYCNGLLGLLVKANLVKGALSLFREHLSWYFAPEARAFNVMMKGLCSSGDVDQAFDLFREMGNFGCVPDVVSYNTVIGGLCRVSSEVGRGYELLKEMKSSKVCVPNVVTYTSVIRGYCKFGTMEDAILVFEEMVDDGVRRNLVTYNVIIDGYCKACEMALALEMYERMIGEGLLPDVVTFTSLIDGYCRSGLIDEAIGLWHNMHARSIFPNAYTFSIMILALCREGRLNEARDFLRELTEKNFVLLPFMYNPVIDGFCKAGNLDEANSIFEEMKQTGSIPDKMTFTILTLGHCMKGRTIEAIELYHQMLNIRCSPDDILLNCLISCLLKAGLPSEAKKIVMTVPREKHDANTTVHGKPLLV